MGLYRISVVGGEPELLAITDREKGEVDYHFPEILADGKTVLVTVFRGGGLHNAAQMPSLKEPRNA